MVLQFSDFYPRSPCGERREPATGRNNQHNIFLSTLSLRRATNCTSIGRPKRLYFYPRSPCGERLWPGLLARPFFIISIHALLAESDYQILDDMSGATNHFYPRSPCGERHERERQHQASLRFLSTLSLRRATGRHRGDDRCPVNFYPRSPCGERPSTQCRL